MKRDIYWPHICDCSDVFFFIIILFLKTYFGAVVRNGSDNAPGGWQRRTVCASELDLGGRGAASVFTQNVHGGA